MANRHTLAEPPEPEPPEQATSCNGSSAASEQFLDETIKFWTPLMGRAVTREDARQIRQNLLGFFRKLQEWQTNEGLHQRDEHCSESAAGERLSDAH